ncbi:DUF1236 domain-containing protein [Bradyrhizobium sp. MOS003]|uniref:DUF1236 domain-containing protein n=1 Tax=Bradyrhizobium sp. MOS003 TaxID=2133946 RepID=UPI001FE1C024|nr:DUF1236 domain-containing protein [Bradyrhizobium sp. MOS003]
MAYAQAPGERSEPKRTEEPAKGAAPERGGAAQERVQERAQGAQERLQGAGREEKGGAAKQEANDDKRQPASSAERNQPKAKDQAQESREPSRDRNREADTTKQGRETGKSSAETKQDKSAPQKSTAESEKSKAGPAGQQNQPPRDAAEQKNNRPATATDTNRTAPTNNAQTAPSGTQTNQVNQTTRTGTQVGQQTSVTTEKQVRISETVSRARLAQPERNLNISIRVGETIPPRVRLHRVPPEIISIEPEYRDYEYFTTDDDVVIVEPRTHRIVSQVPRDPSRARAQMGGSATSSVAAAGSTTSNSLNCRIMRRDASGNVAEAEPTTVGSTGRTDSLSVTVQMPDGSSSAPIALGAPAGNIVVATQGQGDCTVTIEPQTR